MKTRILSGLVMAPLLVLVYLGGWFIWAAAVFVSMVGLKEFYKGFEASGAKPCFKLGYTAVALLYLISLLPVGVEMFMLLWFFLVTVSSMVYGFKVEERKLEDMT
ncbi:MAG: phosphatidate cytidylyltransferase, partial [Firmicutes bacterium]|nr:phosphatidate cytidylyltransferase [Bacillota bacterium]